LAKSVIGTALAVVLRGWGRDRLCFC